MPRTTGGLVPVLHVLTDTRGGRDPLPDVRAVVSSGPCVIQVRAKDLSDRDHLALTAAVVAVARPAGCLVLVDDRVDVAIAADADGVHLGASDLPVDLVRTITPPGFVIGATARDAAAARAAEAAGASYLGVGPAYATRTKPGLPDPIGPEGVAAVAAATDLPVIAVGGVRVAHVPVLRAAGVHGVAVVTAVSEAAHPAAAAAALAGALGRPPTPPAAPWAPRSESGATTIRR